MTTSLQGRPAPTTPGLSYWASHFRDAEFYRDGLRFSDYAPAFYVGISAEHQAACLYADDSALADRLAATLRELPALRQRDFRAVAQRYAIPRA
ncbi:MAG: hypothetical protein JF591_13260 [Lysobacter sp.]|nr:hypothetical protein [Lysobacter sp.]